MCPIGTIVSIFYLLHIYSDYFSGYSRAKRCSDCQVFHTSDSLASDIFRLNPKALTALDILCAAVQGLEKKQIWRVGSMPEAVYNSLPNHPDPALGRGWGGGWGGLQFWQLLVYVRLKVSVNNVL